MADALAQMEGLPLLIHQLVYSLLNRWIEEGCKTSWTLLGGRVTST